MVTCQMSLSISHVTVQGIYSPMEDSLLAFQSLCVQQLRPITCLESSSLERTIQTRPKQHSKFNAMSNANVKFEINRKKCVTAPLFFGLRVFECRPKQHSKFNAMSNANVKFEINRKKCVTAPLFFGLLLEFLSVSRNRSAMKKQSFRIWNR